MAKNNDTPTLEQSKALFLQGLSVAQISEARQLAPSTIITHLAKLAEQDSQFDISRIKPSDDILQQVTKSYQQLLAENADENFNDDGTVKLRPIHESLNKTLGYDVIRLALVFVNP